MISKIIDRYSISVKKRFTEDTTTFILDFHYLFSNGKCVSRRINVAQYLFMMVGIFVESDGINGNILNCGNDLIISYIPL